MKVFFYRQVFMIGWLPRRLSGKGSARQCKRRRFHPRVGKIPWRRAWQPTPEFLPWKFHGQRNLAGYSSWGHKESDTTKHACSRGRLNYYLANIHCMPKTHSILTSMAWIYFLFKKFFLFIWLCQILFAAHRIFSLQCNTQEMFSCGLWDQGN